MRPGHHRCPCFSCSAAGDVLISDRWRPVIHKSPPVVAHVALVFSCIGMRIREVVNLLLSVDIILIEEVRSGLGSQG